MQRILIGVSAMLARNAKSTFTAANNYTIIPSSLRRSLFADPCISEAVGTLGGAAAIDSLSPYRRISGFFPAGLRAGLVQHLAAEQPQPAVRRRRRGLAADHPRARRPQQFHLGFPRHRR